MSFLTQQEIDLAGIAPFASVTRIASYGDSRAYGDSSGAPSSATANLVWKWIEALSQGRISCPPAMRLGRSGFTTTQLASAAVLQPAVERAVAAGARVVAIIASTNDRSSDTTAAATIANLEAIETAWLAAGLSVLWFAEMPRGDSIWTGVDNPPSGPTLGTARLEAHMATHRWIMSRRRRNVFVLDTFALLADRTALVPSQKGWARTGLLGDGLHLGIRGCYTVAKEVVRFIDRAFAPGAAPYLPACYADSYSPATGTGSLNVNPTLQGTAGNLNGATGAVADSWNAGGSLPSGLTATYSKVAVDGREWQQVVYSGTAPTGTPIHNALQRDTAFTSFGGVPIAAGKRVILACEYEIDAGATGVYKINPFVNDGSATWSAADSASAFAYGEYPTEAYRGVFYCDVYTIAGSGPNLRLALGMGFTAGAAVALTLRIGTFSVLPVS